MKRILVAVACLLPFGLAAEAGINRHSPEAAIKAVYKADKTAIEGRGSGVMADNTLRARFFSRSLLRSIAADEVIATQAPSSANTRDPFSDQRHISWPSMSLRSRKLATKRKFWPNSPAATALGSD